MLVKTNEFNVMGDMPGEAVDMSLSGDSLEHIMDILSDLYSNRPAAIVREYATNAIDSHIISGQTRPIEISTPNRLNPNLVIRDYGSGMSKEVLISTYSKYGASTKRGNNLEAGQLGLGSKSGFAYTDQFTVRSVSDGHCCELIMSRNDRGAAEMTIAFDYETGDDSGVTITIPIKQYDVSSVEQEVNRFAEYAKPGTILVNGVENKIPEEWTKVAENLYSCKSDFFDTFVMGNVAYPANLFENLSRYRDIRFICFVEMGSVDFVPSREQLKYTNHTKKTVEAVEEYIMDSVGIMVKELISDGSSRKDKIQAYKIAEKWSSLISPALRLQIEKDVEEIIGENIQYFYARFPHNISNPQDHLTVFKYGYDQSKFSLNISKVASMVGMRFYAITDFAGKSLSRDQARKVLAANPDFAGKDVYLFEGSVSDLDDIFEKWEVMSWEDIKSQKVSRPASPKKVVKAGDLYIGHMIHNRRVLSTNKLMKVTGETFYCSATQYRYEVGMHKVPRGDFKLFLIPPAKQAAFQALYPKSKNLLKYIENRDRQIKNHVKQSARIQSALDYTYNPRRMNNSFDITKITNEDFWEKYKLACTGSKWTNLGSFPHYRYNNAFEAYIHSNYPLFSIQYGRSDLYRQHATDYINMIGEKNGIG